MLLMIIFGALAAWLLIVLIFAGPPWLLSRLLKPRKRRP